MLSNPTHDVAFVDDQVSVTDDPTVAFGCDNETLTVGTGVDITGAEELPPPPHATNSEVKMIAAKLLKMFLFMTRLLPLMR